jgi:hypothetical protein
MKTVLSLLIAGTLLATLNAWAQSEGDVIINEIGNHGTKKAAYTGGDYVELLVLKPEGVKLAGWYVTDLSTPTGTPKETEGRIRFSDAEGSVFKQTIPQGTYVLIWLSAKDSVADVAKQQEDVTLDDGNNRLVVFAHDSPKHIDQQEGYINLTGKDNLALLKSWSKDAAMDAVVWGGSSKWTGCPVTELSPDALGNGALVWFVPKGKSVADFKDNTDPQSWKTSTDVEDATPGGRNKGVDDSTLRSAGK